MFALFLLSTNDVICIHFRSYLLLNAGWQANMQCKLYPIYIEYSTLEWKRSFPHQRDQIR